MKRKKAKMKNKMGLTEPRTLQLPFLHCGWCFCFVVPLMATTKSIVLQGKMRSRTVSCGKEGHGEKKKNRKERKEKKHLITSKIEEGKGKNGESESWESLG